MAPDAQAQATLVQHTPADTPAPPRTVRVTRTARADWQPAEADPPLAAGAVIDGRYRVIAVIGEGGMGRVYETEHLFLRRRLALKLVRRDAGTGEAAARLLQEAVLAGKVPHATVVPVFDCAALPDGQVYVAMELLRGESLEEALLRPQPAQEALRWLAEVARGLAAAHRAGIVHRDVKPANLFLARASDGSVQPRILDFGIAKLLPGLGGEAAAGVQTQAGALLGTPFYMAPERIRGETGDARADLYALGVILYEALTGQLPFVGEGFMEIVGRHLREPPLDPRQAAPRREIPDALAELALALLRKEPEARPGDGDAVAAALLAACESEPLAGLTLGAEAPPAAVDGEGSTQRLEGHVLADMSAKTEVLADAEDLAVRATVRADAGMSAGTGWERGMSSGAGAAPGNEMSSGTGEAPPSEMSPGTGEGGAPRGGAERSAVAARGSGGRSGTGWARTAGAGESTAGSKAVPSGMSSETAGRASPLRSAGLLLACAVGGGLIAWVLLPRGGDEDDAAGAAAAIEAIEAPGSTPSPASPGQGAARGEGASPAATDATGGAAPGLAAAGAPETASSTVAEPERAEATSPAEPEPKAAAGAGEPEPEPAKKRGKKPARKAGTTGPGPRGSGPKIKTDVYDE